MREINKTIRLSAFTGGVNTPSSRFRLRQYTPYLAKAGVEVVEHLPYFEKSCGLPSPFKAAARIPGLLRAKNSDVSWVGKELVKGYCSFERFMKRPRIFDVDDAIWLSKPLGRWAAPAIAKKMDLIIAGNTYLADYFNKHNSNIKILPTAVDTNRFTVKAEGVGSDFVIGWTGLACNYNYLDMISPELETFLADRKDAKLLIVSNRPWQHKLASCPQYEYVQWSSENEVSELHKMDVGLMPLEENLWSRGKCSFKMLQYMAVGIPAIVSPVGMNRDVLAKGDIGFSIGKPGELYEALEALYMDRSKCKQMGEKGRRIIENEYSAEVVAAEFAQLVRELYEGSL